MKIDPYESVTDGTLKPKTRNCRINQQCRKRNGKGNKNQPYRMREPQPAVVNPPSERRQADHESPQVKKRKR